LEVRHVDGCEKAYGCTKGEQRGSHPGKRVVVLAWKPARLLQPIAVVNEQEEKQGGVRQKNAFPRRLFGKKQGDHRACHHQKNGHANQYANDFQKKSKQNEHRYHHVHCNIIGYFEE
jgi:hypothetical protein